MEIDRTLAGLRRMRDKTTCFACSGCGMEHNCSDDGCRIIRSAIEQVQRLSRELSTSEAARTELWKQLISARQELEAVKAAQQKGGVSMESLTKRVDGIAVLESWAIDKDPVSIIQRLCNRLAAYEDTGLEPEEIKNALDVNDIIPEINVTVDRLRELIQAEQDGRLVVLDEKIALSMCAGARAIENNKRLFGVTYSYDIFGVHGGPKEISYFEAAKKLREIAELFLTREEAEAALKGGEG